MTTKYIELVNKIPLDQKAPANYPVKKYLLEKVKKILRNKQTIESAAIKQRQEKILDAYRKNVGFDKKKKTLMDLLEKVEKAEWDLVSLGLNEDGVLLDPQERYHGTFHVFWKSEWREVSKEAADKIREVRKLIEAVEGEVDPFSRNDQLETRLMMATTVGETMAIINAIVDDDVFTIQTQELLQDEDNSTRV